MLYIGLPTLYLCFLFSLWKFGFISWLVAMDWCGAQLGWDSTKGFFTSTLKFFMPVFARIGETDSLLNCLGTSSLSKILEVLASSCRLPSGGDRRSDWSSLGLEVQTGECISETSLTISFSHSSVMQADVLSSWAVRSSSEVSSLMKAASFVEFGCTITSGNFGWVAFGSQVSSLNLRDIDLEYSHQQSNYQRKLSP